MLKNVHYWLHFCLLASPYDPTISLLIMLIFSVSVDLGFLFYSYLRLFSPACGTKEQTGLLQKTNKKTTKRTTSVRRIRKLALKLPWLTLLSQQGVLGDGLRVQEDLRETHHPDPGVTPSCEVTSQDVIAHHHGVQGHAPDGQIVVQWELVQALCTGLEHEELNTRTHTHTL